MSEARWARCSYVECGKLTFWFDERLYYPDVSDAPAPSSDLSGDARSDYEEAAQVARRSPRAAAGLLRVCIERLVNELEPEGESLNAKVGLLVRKGLRVQVQQALDTVRVIGNEAVHPGLMDVNDSAQTVSQLFGIVNIIVDSVITQPKAIADLFNENLTQEQKAGIERRDRPSTEAQGPGEA